MKIMIFTSLYPANEGLGIQPDTRVVHYYAQEWKKAGHDVRVVFLNMNPVKRIMKQGYPFLPHKEIEYEYEGVPICLIKSQLLVPHANQLMKIQAHWVEQILCRYFKRKHPGYIPDQVFVHFPMAFYGINIKSIFNTRISAVFHNCDIDQLKAISDLAAKQYVGSFYSIGSRNKRIKESLLQKTGRTSYILYSGIPEDVIDDTDSCLLRRSQRWNELSILFAGNLIPLKNVDVLIKAICKTKYPCRLTIVGDGPQEDNLKKLADQSSKNITVSFLGRLSREDTLRKMQESDVFAMVSSPETFGLVYLEAMSKGCIVIGSKGEGIDGVIVHGENGFLVEPRNESELTRTIEEIAQFDTEERIGLIESALNTAQSMTDFKMSQFYLEKMIDG